MNEDNQNFAKSFASPAEGINDILGITMDNIMVCVESKWNNTLLVFEIIAK